MIQVPRNITARLLVKALHADDFFLKRVRGSHHIYFHPNGRRVVIAYHSLGDTFPIGTLKGMITDIGWREEDLKRLGF